MSTFAPTRRHLLAGLAGGLVAAPLAGRASAFTREPMDQAARELYLQSCQVRHPGYHDELVAELVSLLRERGVETDAQAVRQALNAAACPLCGCALAELPEAESLAPAAPDEAQPRS